MARAVRIERLKDQVGAAEWLCHHRARHDRSESQLFLAWELRCADDPEQRRHQTDSDDAQQQDHAARATTCCRLCRPALTADSSLCAVFSAPPRAPGTLKATSNDANGKRW